MDTEYDPKDRLADFPRGIDEQIDAIRIEIEKNPDMQDETTASNDAPESPEGDSPPEQA